MSPRLAAQFSAHLVRDPDPGLLAGYLDKFTREGPPLTAETLPLYHATFLAAVLAGDKERAERIATRINRFANTDSKSLRGLAELLAAGPADEHLLRILPLVPLPTEAVYAVLDRPRLAAKK